MNKSVSLSRALRTVVVGFALALIALGAGASSATAAAPYPPTAPSCSASSSSLGLGGQSTSDKSCNGATDDRRADRTEPSSNTESSTASTGFDTLTASVIAAVLLIGGFGLVVAGRRRRQHN